MKSPLNTLRMPKDAGLFGVDRKYDIHTGIDLYCNEFDYVYAIEDGVIKKIAPFTGPKAGSPWWNDTDYIGIVGASGYIVYGEVRSLLKQGDPVQAGAIIGIVQKVLKKDKGLQMSMLHLELYSQFVEDPVTWKLGKPQPEFLENPLKILPDLFNHNATSNGQVIDYFILRENQIADKGYTLDMVEDRPEGVIAYWNYGTLMSFYVYPQFRGKGIYKKVIKEIGSPVLTINDCNIVEFLEANSIQYELVNV